MRKTTFFLLLCLVTATVFAQDSLKVYAGKYIFPDGSVVPEVEVILSDGALFMTSVAGTSSLIKSGVDSFALTEFSGTAFFKRDDKKKIIAVHIEAMGYILDGTKQENAAWAILIFKKEKSFQ